ncbi:hypothetical protein ACFFIX_09645 [Metabacillus herbersteinensis]|uniref:DUF2281 domain-containing protein n=1 Tax=Metabacillus herbersteinensis TaxID=283816 RepID=A0ABV6GEV6_9BACI
MSVDREILKRMIDQISEEDAVEVFDFIGYLNMKRGSAISLHKSDVESLSSDQVLIRQVQKSREERKNGHIYNQEQGLSYLRDKIKEFERGQSI